MNDLGLAPSEVREMTVGEIWAVFWARNRFDRHADAQEQIYQDLLEATSS